jgi:hypothetical protein
VRHQFTVPRIVKQKKEAVHDRTIVSACVILNQDG